MVTIQFKKLSTLATVPTRGSEFAAGYDLYSTEGYTLQPLERKLFKTNIALAIPNGLYGRIAPRSGLAYKDGLDTMAGVIDEDYRGDVGVILINLGDKPKEIKAGDKIAQIIFENYTEAGFSEVYSELPLSARAENGFGSTDNTPPKAPISTEKMPALTEQTKKLEDIVTPPTTQFDGFGGPRSGKSLAEMYQQTGGVPTKRRYIDEIKERDGQ